MAKELGGTTSSSSGSGGPSNTRRSTCGPTLASRRPAPPSVAIWAFTTADGPIHRLTGKPRTKPTSIQRCPRRQQRKRGGNPLKTRPGPAQTNRTTFNLPAFERRKRVPHFSRSASKSLRRWFSRRVRSFSRTMFWSGPVGDAFSENAFTHLLSVQSPTPGPAETCLRVRLLLSAMCALHSL